MKIIFLIEKNLRKKVRILLNPDPLFNETDLRIRIQTKMKNQIEITDPDPSVYITKKKQKNIRFFVYLIFKNIMAN